MVYGIQVNTKWDYGANNQEFPATSTSFALDYNQEGRSCSCVLFVVAGMKRCHKVSISPLALASIAMAVFFNCSCPREVIKVHTQDLQTCPPKPLLDFTYRQRITRFQSQFSFSDSEIGANAHLKSFAAAMSDAKLCNGCCAGLLDIYNKKWNGSAKICQEWTECFAQCKKQTQVGEQEGRKLLGCCCCL